MPALIRGFYFFKVPLKSGGEAILARYAGDVKEAAYPIYILVSRAHLRKRFPLEEKVQDVVDRNFSKIFEDAVQEVMSKNAQKYGLKLL